MPDQSAHLTDIRKPGHQWRAYLTIFTGGAPVMVATATAPSTFPATNIAISVTSGSHTAVVRGARVEVYASDGTSYKGRLRVRFAGTISSANLSVREFSRGHVDIATGDVLKVYKDTSRISDKLVAANETFEPDQLTYTDEGANPPPVVNTSGLWVGKASMLPFTLHNSRSYTVDPDSSGDKTYSTSLPSGLSFDSGDATSEDPEVTGDAGEYVIDVSVTDADNSKTATQYVPVYIHDADHPPYSVLVTDLGGDPENGWEWGVEVLRGDVSLGAFPDEALCVLWVDETIGGARQSFGGLDADRSHIKAVGYISEEEEDGDGQTGRKRLTFRMVSPLRYLNETLGYSKVMTNDATPNAWSEMKALTTKRAKLQILQFYTTWNQTWDVVFGANYQNREYPQFFLQKQSPLAAIRELADAVDAEVTADRRGVMHIHTNPHFVALANRAAVAVQLPLTTQDVLDFRRRRSHRRIVEQVEWSGFSAGYSNNQPVFSRWPGLAPGEGGVVVKRERKIVDASDPQGDLNRRCGNGGALEDGIHQTATGLLYRTEEWELTLRGSYDCADFYGEYLTLPALSKRGNTTSGMLYVLLSATFEPSEKGTGKTRLRLATAAAGAPGQTYVPPQEPDNGLGTWTPPSWDFDIDPIGVPPILPDAGNINYGVRGIGLVLDDGAIALTRDFNRPQSAGGPQDWLATAISGLSGTPCQFVERAGASPKAGIVITSTGIYYVADLVAASPNGTLDYTFSAETTLRSAEANFIATGKAGKLVAVSSYYRTAGGVKATVSTDFRNWVSEVTVNANYATVTREYAPGLGMDQRTGKLYTTAYISTDNAADGYLHTSTDGITWTMIGGLTDEALAGELYLPFAGNENGLLLLFGRTNEGFGPGTLNRFLDASLDGGATVVTDILGAGYGPWYGRSRWGLHAPNDNGNIIYAAVTNRGQTSSGVVRIVRSGSSFGYTWVTGPSSGNPYRRVAALDGSNGRYAILFGLNGRIAFYDHDTGVLDERTGNLVTSAECIGIFGFTP